MEVPAHVGNNALPWYTSKTRGIPPLLSIVKDFHRYLTDRGIRGGKDMGLNVPLTCGHSKLVLPRRRTTGSPLHDSMRICSSNLLPSYRDFTCSSVCNVLPTHCPRPRPRPGDPPTVRDGYWCRGGDQATLSILSRRRMTSFYSHRRASHASLDIQLIVSDVDGTLLNNDQELSQRTLRAIRRAEQERGVSLMIATGKAVGPWTTTILPALASPMPQIFLQGLYIRDALGHVMYSQTLEPSVISHVVDIAKTLNVTVVLYSSDRILCDQTNHHTDRLIFYGEPVPEPVGDVISCINQQHDKEDVDGGNTEHDGGFQNGTISSSRIPIYKCIFMAEDEIIDNVVRPYVEKSLSGVSITSALHGMLEILPPGSSKGNGVKFVLDSLGIHPKNVMALGDGENDVEMLDMVGLGVAVANAGEAAKKSAAIVSSYTNHEDAVARAIETHILDDRMDR